MQINRNRRTGRSESARNPPDKHHVPLLLGILVGSTLSGVLLAADADLEIPEIVVTAQKREESAQKVPISMEVFSSENLKEYNRTDLKDIQEFVPNLAIQSSPGNDEVTIRGFGSAPTNYAFEQDVSIYLDGIYGGRNRQFMTPFFDVDRIEVLRGPQGALLGKNTAAGAISIVTAGPTRTVEGYAIASYDFEQRGEDVQAALSGPLSEALSGRIAVMYTDLNGWIRNDFTGKEEPSTRNELVRGSLRYDGTPGTDVTLKYQYSDTHVDGNSNTPLSATIPTPQLPNFKDAADDFGRPNGDAQISRNASLTANFALGRFTLTSITGLSSFDDLNVVGATSLNPETFGFVSTEHFNQYSEELRLLSPTREKFEYIVGAYADTAGYKNDWIEQYNLLGGVIAGQNSFDFNQHSHTWSVFAQGKWHITDQLSLQASGRYTDDEKHATFVNTADFGFPLYPYNAANGAISSHKFDPSVTLQYEVVPATMLYASYAQGSKGGGFVSNTPEVPPDHFSFNPERAEDFELGIKSGLWDRRVVLDFALYDTRIKDLQASTYDPTTISFVTRNAAAAESRGFESSFQWVVVEGLRLHAALAFLDAKYTDFPGAQCSSLDPPTCSPLTNNAKGQRLPDASRWSGDAGFDYSHSLPGGLRFTLAPSAQFRSNFVVDQGDPNPIYGIQDGYVKYDARMAVGSKNSLWNVAVIGKNLGDKRTKSLVYIFPFANPGAETYQDPGRSIALQVSVKF